MPTDEDLHAHKRASVQSARDQLYWSGPGFVLLIVASVFTYGRFEKWLMLLIVTIGVGGTAATQIFEWRRLRKKDPLELWNETCGPTATAEPAEAAAIGAEAPTVTASTRPWAMEVFSYARRERPWAVGDELFGIYRIDAIKSGGFGFVFLCTNVRDGSTRAIKTVQRSPLSASQVMQDMTREAELWSEVEPHPNIVSCDYVIESPTDRRLWLLLERVDGDPQRGATLREWMKPAELNADELPRILLGICAGMKHVTSAGLIHRDLKPANILMTARGFPKVTDFGLAVPRSEVIDGVSVTIGGTPAYMSPETWETDSKPLAASDVYAFGVILFELLTGSHPFDSHKDLQALARAHRTVVPPDARVVNPTASEVLASLATACLSKDPNDRPTFDAIEGAIRRAWPAVVPHDADEAVVAPGRIAGRVLNLMSFNRFPQAERELQKAMEAIGKDQPVPLQLHYVRFRLLKATGRLAGATESLDYIASFESSSPAILLQKSEALWHLGRHGEALNCLDQALAVEPQNGWCLYAKGQYLLRLGRTDEARTVLLQCGSAPTESGVAAVIALSDLERASGRRAEAYNLLRRVLFANANNMEALIRLGQLEQEMGRSTESIDALRRAQAVGSRKAQTHLEEASLLVAQGRSNEAEAILRPLAENDPPVLQACFDLARILTEARRIPEAMQYFKRILMSQPNTHFEYYLKGFVAGQVFNAWHEALQCANTALAQAPMFDGALKLKAEAEKHLGAQ